MKAIKPIIAAIAMASIAGCASTSNLVVNWPNHGNAPDGVYSRHIALMPYTTQGVTVKASDNWYYGHTQGIQAYAVQGGIVYVTKVKQKPVPVAEKGKSALLKNPTKNPGASSGDTPPDKSHATADSGNQHFLKTHQDSNAAGVQGKKVLTIHFPFNVSDRLYKSSENRMEAFIKNIKSNHEKVKRFAVVGYTDDIGDDNYNIPLSGDRADYIAARIEKAVPSVAVVAIADGSRPVITDNRIKNGRAINRRVEVYQVEE